MVGLDCDSLWDGWCDEHIFLWKDRLKHVQADSWLDLCFAGRINELEPWRQSSVEGWFQEMMVGKRCMKRWMAEG